MRHEERKQSGLASAPSLGFTSGTCYNSDRAYFATSEYLQVGFGGSAIEHLQIDLAAWGYYSGDLDGMFGPLTDEAVRAFQQSSGIQVDGIVGPQTREALCHALGSFWIDGSGGSGGDGGGTPAPTPDTGLFGGPNLMYAGAGVLVAGAVLYFTTQNKG